MKLFRKLFNRAVFLLQKCCNHIRIKIVGVFKLCFIITIIFLVAVCESKDFCGAKLASVTIGLFGIVLCCPEVVFAINAEQRVAVSLWAPWQSIKLSSSRSLPNGCKKPTIQLHFLAFMPIFITFRLLFIVFMDVFMAVFVLFVAFLAAFIFL